MAHDFEDLDSGHKRAKKGDIIAYKPYPHTWGRKEQNDFIHVIVDGLTEEEVSRLCEPQYEDGKYADEQDLENTSPIVGKRRHKIDLDALKENFYPDLKMEDVESATKEYQPLKENDIVVTISAEKPVIYDKVLTESITDVKTINPIDDGNK